MTDTVKAAIAVIVIAAVFFWMLSQLEVLVPSLGIGL